MANKFREKPAEEQPEVQPTPPTTDEALDSTAEGNNADEEREPSKGEHTRTQRGGWLPKILGGDLLATQWVRRQIPLLLLCLVYLLLIVASRYRVERLSRERKASQERVEHLREHRILLQEQYQQSVKISQIAEDLKEVGVGITAGPPYEIER